LAGLFAARERLEFLEEGVEITFAPEYALAPSWIALELFRTETF
jgi:hypothetical protein